MTKDDEIVLDTTDLPTLRRVVKLMDDLLERAEGDDFLQRIGPSYAAKFFRRMVIELESLERVN